MERTRKIESDASRRRTIQFIGISFVSLVVLLFSVCLFSYIKANQVQQEYSIKLQQAYKRLELVNELFSNKELSQNLVREHVYTRDRALKKAVRQQLEQSHEDNRAIVDKLETLLQQKERKALLRELAQERSSYYSHVDSLLELSESNRTQEAQAYTGAYLAPFYSKQQTLLIRLSNEATESSQKRTKEAIQASSSIVDSYSFLLILAVGAAVGAAYMLSRVFRRLRLENELLNAEVLERQELQQALLDSQQAYRRLFDRNPVPMWVYDQHSLKFMEVNEAAIKEYGYNREEFLAMSILDIRPDGEKEKIQRRMLHIDKAADATSYDFVHMRKDGSTFKVELKSHALPERADSYPRLVVSVNVQEREETMAKLEKNEQQLREVSSSIPGAVYQFLVDTEGRESYPFISDGVFELYGVTAEEAYQDADRLFAPVHPDDQKAIAHATEISTRDLTPWLAEFRVWHPKQCKWKWIRGHGLPTLKPDGSVLSNGTLIDITSQKEAQAQLVASEANLRTLLDSSSQSIYLLNKKRELVAFNKAAEEEVKKHLLKPLRKGQDLLSFVDQAQQQQFFENHLTAMQGQAVLYEQGSGDYWYEIAFKPVFDSTEKVIGVTLSIHDRSEQKKAIEVIKKNEAQLAKAQQIAKLGSWEYDLAKDMLTISRNLYDIYELPYKTFTPTFRNIAARFYPDDRARVLEQYQQALATRSDLISEHRIVTESGQVKYLAQIGEVVCDEEGKPVKVAGTTQDITDRKRSEREVIETKNLLQSTIGNIPEIIFSADGTLKLNYLSPKCREITGFTEQELLENDNHWLSMVHDADKEALLQLVVPKLKAGVKTNQEVCITTRDGQTKWLLLRISPMLDANGQLVRVDGSASDMTQYKEAEQKKQQLTEQLVKQNQNLQQFAYIVSHNLRTPIANMLGLASIYDQENPHAPVNGRVVDNLVKSAQLLDTTIRDLNELLTVRSQAEAVQEQVDFHHLLEEVCVALEKEIAQSGASVSCSFEDAPSVVTVKSFASSIMFNLVCNAIKYRHPERKPRVDVTTYRVNGYLCLQIQDNGLGIDLERQRDKVFGLYKRFHPKIEGKGIGLHLVKTQTELLGGKVEVESQPNLGTTFRVYFTQLQYHEHPK
ncbi:PAS domain S-box protein [Pontibacter actiniarum]|nr:PAS domain S-box protein [Pontibacter actiniarum]